MVQIELNAQDLEKVDRLVKAGIFMSREQAVKSSLDIWLSEGDLEKIKKIQSEVSSYCEIHLGNMLGAGVPIRIVVNNRDFYKVPVIGVYEGKTYTYGHLYVDAETLAVDEQLSDSREKIHKIAEQLTGYDGTII